MSGVEIQYIAVLVRTLTCDIPTLLNACIYTTVLHKTDKFPGKMTFFLLNFKLIIQKYALLICFADYYWKGILFLSNEVFAWEPQTRSSLEISSPGPCVGKIILVGILWTF